MASGWFTSQLVNGPLKFLFDFAKQQELLYLEKVYLTQYRDSLQSEMSTQLTGLEDLRDLQREVETNTYNLQKIQRKERFGADLGQYRASAAANNIDLGSAPAQVGMILRGRFERDQAVAAENFRLQQSAADLQSELQISSARSNYEGKLAAANERLDAIEIERRYAIVSGNVEQAGKVLGFINKGTPNAIRLPF